MERILKKPSCRILVHDLNLQGQVEKPYTVVL